MCVVLGAGEYYGCAIDVPDGALVIAADGGWDHARAAGVRVDLLVGDFDSIDADDDVDRLGVGTLRLPTQKDDPDLLTALKVGWLKGARTFHLYGCLGGRVDHSLSAVQLAALVASRGGVAFLHGDGQVVTAVTDGALQFAGGHVDGPVSVFAHSDTARGVCEPGLRYELQDATMSNLMVNGVSNEFIDGRAATVSVREGTLTVVFPAAAPLPTVTHTHAFDGDLGEVSTEVSAVLVRS
ncbi:MAG: thiamine diphosphokinase [Bifidobacterium sp.]|nr:thiamine diphosphokinase [Bifidobacterium sp.]